MQSQHITMSWEDFERLPWCLGWKYEYWDGQAHISPRRQAVTATLLVRPRPVTAPCSLRVVSARDAVQLVAAYVAAFQHTIEFCDWAPEKIRAAAQEDIQRYFAGRRGAALPASRVAVSAAPATGEETVVGAALLAARDERPPLLDMLFVLPPWQRKGLATALVATAVNELHRAGTETLESRYVLGNGGSQAWHHCFGFVDEPDLLKHATKP